MDLGLLSTVKKAPTILNTNVGFQQDRAPPHSTLTIWYKKYYNSSSNYHKNCRVFHKKVKVIVIVPTRDTLHTKFIAKNEQMTILIDEPDVFLLSRKQYIYYDFSIIKNMNKNFVMEKISFYNQ